MTTEGVHRGRLQAAAERTTSVKHLVANVWRRASWQQVIKLKVSTKAYDFQYAFLPFPIGKL